MRARRTVRAVAAVVAAASVGAVGYAAAGVAATDSATGAAPLPQAALAQIQSDLHTATTLELRALADLKKGTRAALKSFAVSLRRARTDLSGAAALLVKSGYRTSPAFNPISNANNAIAIALSYGGSRYRVASTTAFLRSAISLEKKALALVPPLAVTTSPTTTGTTTTTTTPTTTG